MKLLISAGIFSVLGLMHNLILLRLCVRHAPVSKHNTLKHIKMGNCSSRKLDFHKKIQMTHFLLAFFLLNLSKSLKCTENWKYVSKHNIPAWIYFQDASRHLNNKTIRKAILLVHLNFINTQQLIDFFPSLIILHE